MTAQLGVFVDDTEQVYAELLTRAGVIEFKYLPVADASKLAHEITALKPSVVALDYRLDEAPPLSPEQTYKGSSLGQHLRDAAIEFPKSDFGLVLISAEQKIKALYKPDKTAHDIFDLVYTKEELTAEDERIINEIASLGEAYISIRDQPLPIKPEIILGLRDNETAVLNQEIRISLDEAKAPHLAILYLLKNVVKRSGLLIDERDCAARCGVDKITDELSSYLSGQDVDYSGTLAGGWKRWWSHRLEDLLFALFETRPENLTGVERAAIIQEKLGVPVNNAISTWNKSADEYFSFSCACCRNPAEMRHSLAAFDRSFPSFAARRRLCWDCIQNDRNEHLEPPILIDEVDAPIASRVKKMARDGN